jgi:hypothetical protein
VVVESGNVKIPLQKADGNEIGAFMQALFEIAAMMVIRRKRGNASP